MQDCFSKLTDLHLPSPLSAASVSSASSLRLSRCFFFSIKKHLDYAAQVGLLMGQISWASLSLASIGLDFPAVLSLLAGHRSNFLDGS